MPISVMRSMVAVAPVVSRSTKTNGRMLAVVILGWAMIVVFVLSFSARAICRHQRLSCGLPVVVGEIDVGRCHDAEAAAICQRVLVGTLSQFPLTDNGGSCGAGQWMERWRLGGWPGKHRVEHALACFLIKLRFALRNHCLHIGAGRFCGGRADCGDDRRGGNRGRRADSLRCPGCRYLSCGFWMRRVVCRGRCRADAFAQPNIKARRLFGRCWPRPAGAPGQQER